MLVLVSAGRSVSDSIIRRVATGVIVACGLTLVVTGAALALPSVQARLGWAATRTPSYRSGDKIDVAASLYSASRRTVFIFARSSCPACQRSKGQMGALVRDLAAAPGVRVTMLHPRGGLAEDERAFAREIGLNDDARVAVDAEHLKVQRVPTIVVVDETGTILDSHEGAVAEADRRGLVQLTTAKDIHSD